MGGGGIPFLSKSLKTTVGESTLILMMQESRVATPAGSPLWYIAIPGVGSGMLTVGSGHCLPPFLESERTAQANKLRCCFPRQAET